MFTCVLNPTYTDEDFSRLFEDSWDKMSEQFSLSKTDAKEKNQKRVKRMDQIGAVYKDGYMIYLFAGMVNNNVFKMDFALFGKDIAGSRSFLYEQDFFDSINATLKTVFDSVIFNPVSGSSIDSYMGSRKDQTKTMIGSLEKDESVTSEGVTYTINKHNYD